MFGVYLADVLTRCSSHLQGISEVRCENAGGHEPDGLILM